VTEVKFAHLPTMLAASFDTAGIGGIAFRYHQIEVVGEDVPRFGGDCMSNGLVFIHHAPKALLSHIEWTVAGVSGNPVQIKWSALKEASLGFRGSCEYFGNVEAGATLASAFMNLKQLSFEIIQYPSHPESGFRWSFTPRLGMFACATDSAGNLLIGENQLRLAMETAGSNALKLQAELRKLLGQAFDDELEVFRELVDGAESDNGVVTAEAERVTYGQNIRPL